MKEIEKRLKRVESQVGMLFGMVKKIKSEMTVLTIELSKTTKNLLDLTKTLKENQ